MFEIKKVQHTWLVLCISAFWSLLEDWLPWLRRFKVFLSYYKMPGQYIKLYYDNSFHTFSAGLLIMPISNVLNECAGTFFTYWISVQCLRKTRQDISDICHKRCEVFNCLKYSTFYTENVAKSVPSFRMLYYRPFLVYTYISTHARWSVVSLLLAF